MFFHSYICVMFRCFDHGNMHWQLLLRVQQRQLAAPGFLIGQQFKVKNLMIFTMHSPRRSRSSMRNPSPKSVQSGNSTSSMPGLTCPKCGITKKSSKRSCCARGGAWFKNCGDDSDSEFDHTWAEGIQACASTLLRDRV